MITKTHHPFALSALTYRRKGWIGMFPLGRADGPQYAKSPVPKGVTGYEGQDAPFEKIAATCHSPAGRRNIGLRMPRHIVGLDVDDYEDKHGARTLAAAQDALGPLPATWGSTARGPGGSGQMFYQLPVGWIARPDAEEELAKKFGPHIDVIMWARRYACVWPSLHPGLDLAMYQWVRPDGTIADEPPATIELARLDGGWASLLGMRTDDAKASRRGTPKARAITMTTEDGEVWDEPQPTIRLSVAESISGEQVDAVLAMRPGRIRTTIGGAGVWMARMAAAGLITIEQAEQLLMTAVKANGRHSDRWNLANGRNWTAATKVAEGMSKGLAYVPYLVIEDLSRTDLFAQLMNRISR